MKEGWFKLDRNIFDNRVICNSPDHLIVWCALLSESKYKPTDAIFSGKVIKLMPGQLITGRKSLSEKTNVNEHKVQKILSQFEKAQLIAQQTTNHGRLITVLYGNGNENFEQEASQQKHSCNTTKAQQQHTIKDERNKYERRNNTSQATGMYGKEKREEIFDNKPSYDLSRLTKNTVAWKMLREKGLLKSEE